MELSDFTLEEFELLLDVLTMSSLRQVAERRGVSSSRLSKLVRRAEEALQGALFSRRGTQLEITPAAVGFRQKLERLLATSRELHLGRDDVADSLAIAVDPLLAGVIADISPQLVADFTRLRIVSVSSEYAHEFATQSVFDIGVFFSPVVAPPHWEMRSTAETRFSFVRSEPSALALPAHVFLGLLTRDGLKRRRLLPTSFQAPHEREIEVQSVEQLLTVMGCRPSVACLPAYMHHRLGDYTTLSSPQYPSFDVEVAAMCDAARISDRLFKRICGAVSHYVEPSGRKSDQVGSHAR